MKLRALLVLAVLMLPVQAAAADPTKEECSATSEQAQVARHDGKLRAARAGFERCLFENCPAVIRVDCKEQLTAVMHDLPSIIFVAPEGASQFYVTMDGERLTERNGDAYIVDPGSHSFTLTAEGHGPISKQLTIRPAEKQRRETVPFAAPEAASASTPTPLLHDVVYASIGGGALALTMGIVFGIVSKTTYDSANDHCPATGCDTEGVRGGGAAHAFAGVATAGFVAGAILLAGGIALLVWGPSTPPPANTR